MVLELMRFTQMVGVSLSVQSRRLSSLPQFYAHSSAVLLEVAASFPVFMPLSRHSAAVQTLRGAELLCRSLAMRRVPSLGGRHL